MLGTNVGDCFLKGLGWAKEWGQNWLRKDEERERMKRRWKVKNGSMFSDRICIETIFGLLGRGGELGSSRCCFCLSLPKMAIEATQFPDYLPPS